MKMDTSVAPIDPVPLENISLQKQYNESHVKTKEMKNTPTWDEFINNTTLHGVKYIFERGLKIRRATWFVAVLAATVLFVVQVSDRTAVFFQYKTNVAVKVNYVNKVTFPSVTICNQNNYRLSATVDWGLYEFINKIYSTRYTEYIKSLSEKICQFSHSHSRSTDLSDKALFQCSWHHDDCDVSEDFEMVLTDLGVCYTFNGGNIPRSISKAGSNSALRLRLNVEQYEYMKGQEIDVGVKILLHDQGEVPQMKDQGFAVAPGTHTLAAIERAEVSNLPDPYGDCEAENPIPVSECQLRCKTKVVVGRCQCHDVYMKPYWKNNTASQMCSMKEKFLCINRLEHLYENSCNCSVPCKRVLYKPNLSYSQLSHLNIEKLVLKNEDEEADLKEKFHHALEAAARNKEQIISQDKEMLENLVSRVTNLTDQVEVHLKMAYYFLEESKTAHLVRHKLIKKDYQRIDNLWRNIINLLSSFGNLNTNFNQIYEARSELWKLMAFKDNTSKTVEFLLFCAKMNDKMVDGINTENPPPYPDVEVDSLPWVNISSKEQCDAAFTGFKQHFLSFASNNNIEYDKELADIQEGFANLTSEEKSRYYYYGECFSTLDEAKNIVNSFTETFQLSINITKSSNFKEALDFTREILNHYEGFLTSQSASLEMDNRLKEACHWIPAFVTQTDEIVDGALDALEQAGFFARDAQNALYRLYSHEKDTLSTIIRRMGGIILNQTSAYNSRHITKLELARRVSSEKFDESTKILRDANDNIKHYITTYLDALYDGQEQSENAYSTLEYSISLPVIVNNHTVYDFEIMKEIRELALAGDSYWAEQYSIQPPYLTNIIPKVYGRMGEPIERMKRTIPRSLDDLLEQIEVVTEKMKEYNRSATMDSDFFIENFIQVDIFYQELSYEEIEQNIAFEFLSLLSEIGGFLGLLLGASVLTVCELLDYLMLSIIRKKKDGKIDNTRQGVTHK